MTTPVNTSVCVRQLNNRLFEELAMDVYDEVDRRENDAGEPRLPPNALFFHLITLFCLFPIWKVDTEIANASPRHISEQNK